jgi:hypothetical protein
LALRLTDKLGHARAAALGWKNAMFLLTSRHGADHAATAAGDEKSGLWFGAPRGCEGHDLVGVAWTIFMSSVRH